MFSEPPDYQSGYYSSKDCEPNESETKMLSGYLYHETFPKTSREATEDQRNMDVALLAEEEAAAAAQRPEKPVREKRQATEVDGQSPLRSQAGDRQRSNAASVLTAAEERDEGSRASKKLKTKLEKLPDAELIGMNEHGPTYSVMMARTYILVPDRDWSGLCNGTITFYIRFKRTRL